MANEVYANGMELACKAGSGKTIASFPDVCFTPPENPATPPGVPIPYPNTGFASDTTKGSKNVKITGKEVMLKNKSYFKKSTGDEAGSAAKKGVISSTNRGKVYFIKWSMDVKFEGENVDRHLDLTTDNHASPMANEAVPWAFIDTGTFATDDKCKKDRENEKKACEDYKPNGKKDACKDAGLDEPIPNSDDEAVCMGYKSKADFGNQKAKRANANNKAAKCIQARRCRLVPYSPKKNTAACCKSQTGDHIVPKSSFFQDKYGGTPMPGWENYNAGNAPVMCLEGGSTNGSHGLRHTFHKSMIHKGMSNKPDTLSFNKEVEFCVEGAAFVAPHCSPDCISNQLKDGHEGMGDKRKKIRHSRTGSDPSPSEMQSMKSFRKTAR